SLLWLKRLLKEFPEVKGTELHINEWGMSSNFWRNIEDHPGLTYRNNHESPLFLVKLVNSLYQLEDNHNFSVSMLLYWGFVGEAEKDVFFNGERELTTAGNIPKPVQTGFEMLAKLKENRLLVKRSKKDGHMGLLATSSESQDISFIVYNYEEDERDLEMTDKISIQLKGLSPNSSYRLVVTKLDREANNTYAAWEQLGRPNTSQEADLTTLMKASELSDFSESSVSTNEEGLLILPVELMRHSMGLFELVLN
ncbi:MAG: hypothetical protein AAGC88_14990, partial [Bacteroidota bacterium]